ncbi:MAG: type II toxin-antitoxin system PemK/MazF family toxin [Vulcanimicrobiaceae bacterium]
MVKRGEIWLVGLDPTVGSEIRKARPCVVVSPSDLHDHLRTVIVAPMTTGSSPAPFRVAVSFQGKRGLILLDQVRAVDKVRLVRRLGAGSGKQIASALQVLREMFTA